VKNVTALQTFYKHYSNLETMETTPRIDEFFWFSFEGLQGIWCRVLSLQLANCSMFHVPCSMRPTFQVTELFQSGSESFKKYPKMQPLPIIARANFVGHRELQKRRPIGAISRKLATATAFVIERVGPTSVNSFSSLSRLSSLSRPRPRRGRSDDVTVLSGLRSVTLAVNKQICMWVRLHSFLVILEYVSTVNNSYQNG